MLPATTQKTVSVYSLQFLLACGVCVWFLMFLVTRIHIFHEAYTHEVKMRDDEKWLVEQCAKHDFYHNLKQHSALCDEVQGKEKSILFLNALHHMAANTYLCGYEPCGSLITNVLEWCMTRGLVLTLCMVFLILLLPTLLLPLFRTYLNNMADQRMHQLYNTPFGMDNYMRNQNHVYRLE